MFRITFLLIGLSGVRLNPTSCAEDSQCPSGFYCEESVHYCRECLHCEDLKREPPSPPEVCVKSVVQCGVCFKSLVQTLSGQCTSATAKSPGGILPSYAWVAIAASLVLMIVILALFVKTKTFKFAYAARTSVQSLHTVAIAENACAPPPPPYNDFDDVSPSSSLNQSEAFERQKLVASPHACISPTPEIRLCENSSMQYARVFNDPGHMRLPHDGTRYNSTETPVSLDEDIRSGNIFATSSASSISSQTAVQPAWTVGTIRGNNINTTNSSESGESDRKINSLSRKYRFGEEEFQDSNNNFTAGDEDSAGRRTNGSAAYCAGIVAGPSFIINVVENINNVAMTNEFQT